jgi:hypothetical protein
VSAGGLAVTRLPKKRDSLGLARALEASGLPWQDPIAVRDHHARAARSSISDHYNRAWFSHCGA